MFNPLIFLAFLSREQPPSGGCVLKQLEDEQGLVYKGAATFGWLCVETVAETWERLILMAATFGWLCVETQIIRRDEDSWLAATFGWLCVETASCTCSFSCFLAATFGWLCVETMLYLLGLSNCLCSHLRVAVC